MGRGVLLLIAAAALPGRLLADDPGMEFFEKKIRPVLVEQCYGCHSAKAEKVKGGLLLDTREGIRRGGESGHAVVPGDAGAGLLLGALRYEELQMPPDRKLPDNVIADFETWIKMGAPDPRESTSVVKPSSSIDLATAREFWSFQPPTRHEPPSVSNPQWIAKPIDAFVLSRLEQAGLPPNPPADRRTLIRRVTFDLIGLPPTPEEVEAFVADTAPDAYERLVERLLESPHYGERWARMWLDLSRYAEDQAHIVGNDTSLCYPNAYLYRDWVIRVLNNDMPYDDFLKRQLAVDLMDPSAESELVALGFIGLGPKYYRRNAPEVMADEWEDRVDIVSRGLLGLTVACARCHDHKFDPIPTTDYYALAGVFASTEMFNRPLDDNREKTDSGQAKKAEDALHIIRDTQPTDLNVLIRGDVKNRGPVVPRHFLQVLSSSEQPFQNGSGRLELAEAIANRSNPLTARVLVNRVWALNFGQPLVATPSNFGALGEQPSHPELLDDFAVRFMEAGWSLKWLQREMVLSSAYRQSSHIDPAKQTADAENRLLWRMNRRRLSIEQWRDAVLSVAGRLDPTVGGKSIEPNNPDEQRRTLYSKVSRLDLDSLLELFDFPDPNAHSERRGQTTTALQKLFVLNSPFMVRQSEALAERVLRESPSDQPSRVGSAYRLVFGREPSEQELRLAVRFLGENDARLSARWAEYAQVLLASNELLMLD